MTASSDSASADLLRITTAGSVDDGKSTLVGRLLHDSQSIHTDQLAALESLTKQRGETGLNFSLLTDGLRDEREQGITIDVAYRYFATSRRRFILADTPGHVQFTRNMVTGASCASLMVLLIDARKGLVEQTCRHCLIASLLRISHLVLCINKMDLVEWSQERFEEIVAQFKGFASRLEIPDIRFIPISALHGDNVVDLSARTPWYNGGALLYTLETVYIGGDFNHVDARFPVQTVIRPNNDEHHDYRGFAGRVAAGVFRPGDDVILLPSRRESRVRTISSLGTPVAEAFFPMSVEITLADEVDLSRGDMLAKPHNQPRMGQEIEAMIFWFAEQTMQYNARYRIQHTTRDALCTISAVRYEIDICTLRRKEEIRLFGPNDVGRVQLRTSVPLFFDAYKRNRITGSFILIDEFTAATVAAGMII